MEARGEQFIDRALEFLRTFEYCDHFANSRDPLSHSHCVTSCKRIIAPTNVNKLDAIERLLDPTWRERNATQIHSSRIEHSVGQRRGGWTSRRLAGPEIGMTRTIN